MRVVFKTVGRDRKTWAEIIPEEFRNDPWNWMAKAIRKSGALRSQDVDFETDDDDRTGTIVVGDFRAVGRYEIQTAIVCQLCQAPAYHDINSNTLIVCSANERHIRDTNNPTKQFIDCVDGPTLSEL